MCTYLRDTELDVQIAENDIEVYKIVKIKHYKWYAPCMDVPYETKELSSKLGTPKKLKYDLVVCIHMHIKLMQYMLYQKLLEHIKMKHWLLSKQLYQKIQVTIEAQWMMTSMYQTI